MLIIAIASMKGGVGKTTLAVHLAEAFAKRKVRTLVVDMDTQGHAALYLGAEDKAKRDAAFKLLTAIELEGEYGFTPVRDLITAGVRENLDIIAGGPRTAHAEAFLNTRLGRERVLARRLKEVEDQYHACIIDVPPGFTTVSSVTLAAAKGVLAPVTPGKGPESGVEMLVKRLDSMRREVELAPAIVGVVPNIVAAREKESRALLEFVEAFPHSAPIRRAVKMAEATRTGQTISEYAPREKVAEDYDALSKWAAKRMTSV